MSNFEIIYNYPVVIFFVICFVVFSLLRRYYIKTSVKNKKLIILLKFLTFSLTILFLFDPVLITKSKYEKDSKHLFLIDNSLSMKMTSGNETEKLNQFIEGNNKDNYLFYKFGDNLSSIDSVLNYDENNTNLYAALNSKFIKTGVLEENIRSINIISDGNFKNEFLSTLLYTIPFNSVYTGEFKNENDIFISDVIYNEEISFHDNYKNEFEVLVSFEGENLSNQYFNLIVTNNDKQVLTKKALIPQNNTNTRIVFNINKNESVNKIKLKIEKISGEINTLNNEISLVQKVGVEKIISIFENNLGLDSKFIKRFLSDNSYEYSVNNYKNKTDLGIFIGFPSKKGKKISQKEKEFIRKVKSKIIILDKNSDISRFKEFFGIDDILIAGKYVNGKLSDIKEGSSSYAYDFESEVITLNNLPEIRFIQKLSSNDYTTLLNAEYNNNLYPVVIQKSDKHSKTVIINIDEMWKLFFSVKSLNNKMNFEKFLLNIIDYLTIKNSDNRITISPAKNEYTLGESVVFSGDIFDLDYKKLKNEKVSISIDELDLNTDAVYNGNKYKSALHIKEPGIYTYKISVRRGDEIFASKKGSFKIIENFYERSKISPDTMQMHVLSSRNNGKIYKFSEIDNLVNELDTTPVFEEKKENIPLTRNYYYLIVLIILYTIEWVLRKRENLS